MVLSKYLHIFSKDLEEILILLSSLFKDSFFISSSLLVAIFIL